MVIDIADSCIACNACVSICPRYIFEIDEEKKKARTNENISRCHDCGHCVAICPKSAITHRRMGANNEDSFPLKGKKWTYEEILEILRQRRSIRFFADAEPTDEQIEKLIQLGKYAPTGHNAQRVSYTLVRNREDVKFLYESVITFFQHTIKNLKNPFYVALAYILGKGEKIKKAKANLYRLESHIAFYHQKIDKIFHSAPVLLLLHTDNKAATPIEDCAIAAQNIMVGAPSLDLGATYIGYFTNAWLYSKKIRKITSLPPDHTLYACLALGKPKYSFQRLIPRPDPLAVKWKKQV